MSRPKSQATIEHERDREIRRQRQALKREEQERRRAERLERRARRETIRNGGPVLVKPDLDSDPCYRALRGFHPLCFCESCREIKREDWMKTEDLCLGCFYGEGGVIRETPSQTAEETKGGAARTAAPPFGTKRGLKREPEPTGDSSPQLQLEL